MIQVRKHLDKKLWFTEDLHLEKADQVKENNNNQQTKSQQNIDRVKVKRITTIYPG